jgi:hypothetical protein
MYCKQCGNLCDRDSNFCINCGLALRPSNTKSNYLNKFADNGFLLIAILTLLPNIFHLLFRSFLSDTATETPFTIIEFSFLTLLIAQFVLLVLLTKSKTYKLIIIIIGIICLLLPVMQLLTNHPVSNEIYTPE